MIENGGDTVFAARDRPVDAFACEEQRSANGGGFARVDKRLPERGRFVEPGEMIERGDLNGVMPGGGG